MIFGIRIAADDPDLLIMHEQLTDFPYKRLVPEAMQNIRKIMQSASKEVIARDSLLDVPFALLTYPSIMTEMCNCLWPRPTS